MKKKLKKAKENLLDLVRDELPDDYDVETHFNPDYNPWDQRLCLNPNGDLYEAMRSGKASVVTDTIDTWTERGILLDGGAGPGALHVRGGLPRGAPPAA